jgi:hypothetical protein
VSYLPSAIRGHLLPACTLPVPLHLSHLIVEVPTGMRPSPPQAGQIVVRGSAMRFLRACAA